MSIEVKHLSFSYGNRQVLRDISFSVGKGRLLSVLGPNGVGKSTLFRCILGLLHGFQGEITVDGAVVSNLGARELARKVAYIPQSNYPAFQYSVFDMVLMGTTAQSRGFSPPGPKQEAAARDALERLDIGHLAGRSYTRLSGGERQLVLIARALAQQSPVLLMDEPTANLDYGNQIRVLTKVRALADAGYTIVQSTHNPEQSYLFSHQILAMKDGRVLAHGAPGDVMNEDLIRALYGIDAEVVPLRDGRMRVCIPRDLPTFSPCEQVEYNPVSSNQ
ncbi:ABC transporter ATP-binding protein [uncultured Pseudoflavonifractor sp.]|uniref:ABC transporter ATP-binding protein n=1 Tax=uncultured Pseudoflavonifractor sp. TaxID=1221379 RepID=UPI0025FC602A|nr:ABC transporter ATP-binding protein [uncultured Pseudoflavonifractor sp.]